MLLVVVADQRLGIGADHGGDTSDVPPGVEVAAAGREIVLLDAPDDRFPDAVCSLTCVTVRPDSGAPPPACHRCSRCASKGSRRTCHPRTGAITKCRHPIGYRRWSHCYRVRHDLDRDQRPSRFGTPPDAGRSEPPPDFSFEPAPWMKPWQSPASRLPRRRSVATERAEYLAQVVGFDEDVAGLRSLAGADDAAALEQVHQPACLREPDPQLALEHGRRPELGRLRSAEPPRSSGPGRRQHPRCCHPGWTPRPGRGRQVFPVLRFTLGLAVRRRFP